VIVIVPLAGPDFVQPGGTLKGLRSIDGVPLLLDTLQTRPWADIVPHDRYSFVMQDVPEARCFAENQLRQWFPGCKVTLLSALTSGAAMSALSAAGAVAGCHPGPVVIDLADIRYQCGLASVQQALAPPDVGGVALTFTSENPAYSYLRRDEGGAVVEAAEKRVISNDASAGTYIFASMAIFLRAVAHALENAEQQTHRGLFFVCPLMNGVLDAGMAVATVPVRDVHDVKMIPDG